MWLITTMVESVCLIFGSLAGAILLCMVLWRVLTLIKHPELGALIIGIGTALALLVPFTHSPFIRMMLLFATAGAIPLWIAGREWRSAHKASPPHSGRRQIG